MTENLKICPFCGSEAEIIGYDDGMYQCVCQNCKSTQGVFYDFPEEAAFAWNNRPIEDLKDDENAWLEKNLKDYNRVMLENARLREALEFYALGKHLLKASGVVCDAYDIVSGQVENGKYAKEVLEGCAK